MSIVDQPDHGTLTVNATGTVDYDHDGSETTSDSFSYRVQDDGGAMSNTATVNLTITPQNDSPVANNELELDRPQATITHDQIDRFKSDYRLTLPPHSMTALGWQIP